MSTGTVARPPSIRGSFDPADELLLRLVPLVRFQAPPRASGLG